MKIIKKRIVYEIFYVLRFYVFKIRQFLNLIISETKYHTEKFYFTFSIYFFQEESQPEISRIDVDSTFL